ncbi:helix-turn-helix transcriptional regulator [Chitinasiproducens palmae]|uniref:Helix-turn-helix domain-containing protein n=1 Tax=Chitinasiproducens palmae TaxID=1770053 RepID=A0A1H2PW75_9BURK|nr:helix-turn-helix transcriptional regulator [Chitinasiproducens palmae]SDV50762.1 Helix-turn-helix domain-containing protein [Chitinasiproducens palmae]
MPNDSEKALGSFLRDRRGRLDAAALGFDVGRRRTPGLRREEVAQRANISPTWYTWLEQGRGGAPSKTVLDRIAAGLMLTEPEREHLFLLAFGHPPEPRYKGSDEITPRLQRVLDGMPTHPAIVRTATWDVVAWNKAAATVMTDYGTLPRQQRNILRIMFCDARVRAVQDDWQSVARFVVAAFRADVARVGASAETARLVEQLSLASAEFAELWRSNDIASHHEGLKRLRHPELGLIELGYSTFSVDGRPDLSMMVYTPANDEIDQRIASLVTARERSKENREVAAKPRMVSSKAV